MGTLSKKTTILFSAEFHQRLARLAEKRGISLGDLVRAACEKQYGLFSKEERVEALRELSEMDLPVGDPARMKKEGTPDPEALLP